MRPLEGIRVLDLSRLVGGGMVGMLLADFGADVVKVEQPGAGDPLRQWTHEGKPLWWRVYGRNKRSITLDLQQLRGKEILRALVPRFDVLIESFVPGSLDRLGFTWEELHSLNTRLVLLRISGWGQDGPGSARPGFGTLVEAASGFAAMNGEPDGAPIVPAYPMADMVSALYGCNAIMFALYHRDQHGGEGQVIDLALFESMFSVLGPLAAEYAVSGKVRPRIGSRSKNAAPRGVYLTQDGKYLAVSGSTPKMAERFLRAYGLERMLEDPRFASNEERVKHVAELDAEIERAIGARSLEDNMAVVNQNELTAVPVQTIEEVERDPHWRARQLTLDFEDGAGTVRMHHVVPRLSLTPGEIKWGGRVTPGADNKAIYGDELGLPALELDKLRNDGFI
ncbi:MAG TPA: CoA transferase [Anaerolineae bacterium]